MSKRVGLAEREKTRSSVRPLDALFAPSAENFMPKPEESKETAPKKTKKKTRKRKVIRQTYYMEPEIIEALRIMDFKSRKGISTILNEILKNGIDGEILKEAEKNLAERGEAS